MEVAYLFERDAANPDVQSGRPAAILQEFERAGWTVRRCFPLPSAPKSSLVERMVRRLAKARGLGYFNGRSRRDLLAMAARADTLLRQSSYDIIFCPGTLPISYLHPDRPVAISSDTTYHGMANYYPEMSRLTRYQDRQFERAERAAMAKPQLFVYASEWAARSAMQDYGVPADRIAVIPSGANFGTRNTTAAVESFLAGRRRDRVDLLFVGKDWSRKGGAICLEATARLNQRGMAATLHVVGCSPTIPATIQPHVQVHGLLRRSVPAERERLEALFQNAHFLFTPSRAEAYGMVFCDANAFGVPCLTTATGGITTIIRDGVNGYALPLAASAEDYAARLSELVADPARYRQLAWDSYYEFKQRLNWQSWMDAFMRRIELLVPERVAA